MHAYYLDGLLSAGALFRRMFTPWACIILERVCFVEIHDIGEGLFCGHILCRRGFTESRVVT